MEGQDEEGLGDHRKERQPPQIPPDVPCVHQANCQSVAENREGQPSYPPEFRVLGKKTVPTWSTTIVRMANSFKKFVSRLV